MASEASVKILEAHLRRGGYARAARFLRDQYVIERLTLFKPNEPLVVTLPSGRQIGLKKAQGLAELAATLQRLHTGSMVHSRHQLVDALKHELQVVQARCPGNQWLPVTRPYGRMAQFIAQPKKLEEQTKIVQLWRQYQRQHPGISPIQGVGPRIVRELGFSVDMYSALDRLVECNPDAVVIALLTVIHSDQSVRMYKTDPVCQLLQQAQVLPNADGIAVAEQVRAPLLRVLAKVFAFNFYQGEKLPRLLVLIASANRIPGATPSEVLRTLVEIGETYGIEEVRRAATELNRALIHMLSVAPSIVVEEARAYTGPDEPPSEWAVVSESLDHVDPGLPEEVMRTLLGAALNRAHLKKRYGLPLEEYWVACPDPVLARAGIQRLTFQTETVGLSVRCLTTPLNVRFTLGMPPATVSRGALLAALIAGIIYEAMVTQRENFASVETQGKINLKWATTSPASPRATRRTRTVVGRVNRIRGITRGNNPIPKDKRASFVVPHLRLLLPGGCPSGEAMAHAAEHGITLPTGYTFVRGHLRGAGSTPLTREFSVAEIALETVARLRKQVQR